MAPAGYISQVPLSTGWAGPGLEGEDEGRDRDKPAFSLISTFLP